MIRILILLVILAFSRSAFAVLPDEQLPDPALEARARAISKQLRCVVCQNQSIDDSDAPLARDLRIIVREQLQAGASDEQAVEYLVDRYGNYVLLKPPFEFATYALWFGPAVFLLLGGGLVAFYLRQRRRSGPLPDLDVDEEVRLDTILKGDRP